MDKSRIVITGIGLAAPGADTLAAFRTNLLAGKSGVATVELRYMGLHPAGICSFDETRYGPAAWISVRRARFPTA